MTRTYKKSLPTTIVVRISDVFLNGKRIDLNYSGIGGGINSSSQIGSKVNEMRSDVWINSEATCLPQSTSPPSSLSILQNNTMRIKSLDNPNIFSIAAKPVTPSSSSSLASIQVIGVIPGQLITQK
jgi:hypothetical protein